MFRKIPINTQEIFSFAESGRVRKREVKELSLYYAICCFCVLIIPTYSKVHILFFLVKCILKILSLAVLFPQLITVYTVPGMDPDWLIGERGNEKGKVPVTYLELLS